MAMSLTPDCKILKDFAKDLSLQKRRSPLTVKAYVDVLRRFFDFFDPPLKMMTPPSEGLPLAPERLQNYLQSLAKELSPTSQALHVGALRCFFKWCVQKKLSPTDYHLYLTRPKIRPRLQKIVDEEDLLFLMKEINRRPPIEQLLFHLLYGSGLRVSEAFAIKKEDFSVAQRELTLIGKGKRERRVPLTPVAFELLKDFHERAPEPDSSPWPDSLSVRKMQQWTENWGKRALLSEQSGRLHPHKLRHSLATHLLRRGAPLPELQKLLGHQRLSTTERYTHLNYEDLARVYDQAMPQKLKK